MWWYMPAKKGLKVRNGKELVPDIITQFCLDVEGLLPQDQTPYHLWQTGSQRHVCYWPKQRLG
jgi:hypothetical protein